MTTSASQPIDLKDLIGAMEMQMDGISTYFDRQTGRIEQIFSDDQCTLERELDHPKQDGQASSLTPETVELIFPVNNNSSGRFVRLPTEWDIHEWEIMAAFARSQKDKSISDQLEDAIHGRGAFRHFKSTVERLDLLKAWFAFKAEWMEDIARDWCKDHDIPVKGDKPSAPKTN